VSPSLLVVNDPEKLPEMYARSADKSDWYMTPVFGPIENVIVTLPHKDHSRLRKIMAGPYSFSNVKKLEDLVNFRIARWFERLDEVFISQGKPVDFTKWSV
jgi:cytochrome P450